jgi:hypothetical protein
MKNIAFLWAFLAVSVALAQDKPSMVGTWKLDIAQSDLGSEPAPKSWIGTCTKETAQTFAFRVHGIDDKGKPFAYSWSGPEDGSMHPIMSASKPVGQASAQKEPDGSIKRSGKEPDGTFESHVVLSPDGSTLTEEMTEKSADGKVVHQRAVYHRLGSSHQNASASPAS